MTRVLIVDDHAAVRQALALIFAQERRFESVSQAGSLAEARPLLATTDVALIDLELPDGSGMALARDLRDANPRGRSLVLTASTDRVEYAHAVEAGASGIIHKSSPITAIIEAVVRLAGGEYLLTPAEILDLMRHAAQRREDAQDAKRVVERLTAREREVLEALAEGLTDKQIADRLRISPETERTHVVNLLGKLGVHSRLQALVFAIRHRLVRID